MRDGNAWSPYLSTRGGGLGLLDGEMLGPRIGPRLFREITTPTQGGAYSQYRFTILTQDATGAILGSCTVNLFDSATNVLLQTQTSDLLGVCAFVLGTGTQQCYVVAYNTVSTEVDGTSVRTLVAS